MSGESLPVSPDIAQLNGSGGVATASKPAIIGQQQNRPVNTTEPPPTPVPDGTEKLQEAVQTEQKAEPVQTTPTPEPAQAEKSYKDAEWRKNRSEVQTYYDELVDKAVQVIAPFRKQDGTLDLDKIASIYSGQNPEEAVKLTALIEALKVNDFLDFGKLSDTKYNAASGNFTRDGKEDNFARHLKVILEAVDDGVKGKLQGESLDNAKAIQAELSPRIFNTKVDYDGQKLEGVVVDMRKPRTDFDILYARKENPFACTTVLIGIIRELRELKNIQKTNPDLYRSLFVAYKSVASSELPEGVKIQIMNDVFAKLETTYTEDFPRMRSSVSGFSDVYSEVSIRNRQIRQTESEDKRNSNRFQRLFLEKAVARGAISEADSTAIQARWNSEGVDGLTILNQLEEAQVLDYKVDKSSSIFKFVEKLNAKFDAKRLDPVIQTLLQNSGALHLVSAEALGAGGLLSENFLIGISEATGIPVDDLNNRLKEKKFNLEELAAGKLPYLMIFYGILAPMMGEGEEDNESPQAMAG